MKNLFIILFIFLGAGNTLLTSCSSRKSDPTPGISAPVGKIDFKIDGTAFETPGAAQVANNEIILGGLVNSKGISIIISKSATTGTYDIKGADLGITPDVAVTYTDGISNDYTSIFAVSGTSVGTVTITEIDQTNKTISGTFSSTVFLSDGTTSVSLTEGSFNKLPYSTQSASSLSAKIDGTAFTAGVTVGVSQTGVIAVNGQMVNGSQILTITTNSDITAGTYNIGDFTSSIFATYTTVSGSNTTIFISTSGTLTITKHDTTQKRIEGTFSFETESFADSSAGPTVTEGSFAVTYN